MRRSSPPRGGARDRRDPRAGRHVVAFHKPVGVVTTHADEHGRETVYDRLRAALPLRLRGVEWHAVGRLDKDTSGLLLFTDDGALVHFATQPSSGLVKTYRVLAKGLLDDAKVAPLRRGVELTGGLGRSAPAVVRILGHRIATTDLELEISEGKNREVRRMLLAIDSQAIRLQRVKIGGLELGELAEGAVREVDEQELREKLGYVRTDTARLDTRPRGRRR